MGNKVVFLLLALSSAAFSSGAFQTDWSGGPHALGTVFQWDSTFVEEEGMEWALYPGLLTMNSGLQEHPVMNLFHVKTIHTADMDGDSDIDILSGETLADSRLSWFENVDGHGFSWEAHDIRTDFDRSKGLAAVDLDGDGDLDVIGTFTMTMSQDGCMYWFENEDGTGTDWSTHPIETCSGDMGSLSAGDIDGDGTADCAIAYESDNIRVYLNSFGTGQDWSTNTIAGVIDDVQDLYLADVDGDGDLDILSAHSLYVDSGELHWYENTDGTGTAWQDHFILHFRHACALQGIDFDLDGDCDIVASGTGYGGDLSWFENADGVGTEWHEWGICGDMGPDDCAAGDMDGDGDTDAAAPDFYFNPYWYENADGAGHQWIWHSIDEGFEYCSLVYSDDVDLDGCSDVITGSGVMAALSWWDTEGYSQEGELVSRILDTGCQPDWGSIGWNCIEPQGTELCFRLRSSSDSVYMGSWSLDVTEPGNLDPFVDDGDRYFQYMVVMEASVPDSAPVLEDVTVTWDSLSGTGGSTRVGELLRFENPSASGRSIPVHLDLPETSPVSLRLFDVSGRMVHSVYIPQLQEGVQEILLPARPPGLYFIKVQLSFDDVCRSLVVTAD